MDIAILKLKNSQFKENLGDVINNPGGVRFNNVSSKRDERLYLSFEDFDSTKANITNIKLYAKAYENDIGLDKYEIDKTIDYTTLPNLVGAPYRLSSAFKQDVYTGIYVEGTDALAKGVCLKLRNSANPIYYGSMYVNTSGNEPYLEVEFTPDFSPIAKNLKLTGKDVEQDIFVSWEAEDPQTYYYMDVIQNGATVYTTQAYTSLTNAVIPKGKLSPDVEAVVRIKINVNFHGAAVNGIGYATTTYTGSLTKPVVSNLSHLGEYWEKDITVNWRADYQDGYEYECYYNNAKAKEGTGINAKSFTIPARTFSGILPSSVSVRVFRTYNGMKYYSDWVEIRMTLKDILATISNLSIEGSEWEKPLKLSWRSENQEQFRIEAFKSNTIINTYTGTTETEYVIPEETLLQGEYSFKVWVAYANRFVSSTERSSTLKDVQATVKNLFISGSNIDLDLSLSWESTDQHKYEVEIYKDTTQVKAYSGALDKDVSIQHNSLTTGLHNFKVRVAYKDRWTQWIEINATLVEAMPSIGVLEPDGVIIDKDYPTRIWWDSNNQTKWKITLDGGTPVTGTWQTEHIINAGTLQTGKHALNLVVTYVTGAGVEKTAFKNAEFIVQGKPPIPTFTNSNNFTTSRPTLTWDTQDQQGYLLEILKDDALVWSTEWQNGLVTRQKVLTYLENGTYTAKLKIINQFSVESDYGKTTFTINATENTPITLKASKKGNSVFLAWDNIGYIFEKFYIIRNGEVIAKTDDTIFTDHTVFGETEYIIRGINANDIFKDSNKAVTGFIVDYSSMATVDALDQMLNVSVSKEPYSFRGTLDISNSIVHMTGRSLPVAIFGEHETNTYSITFSQKQLGNFAEMYRKRKVFCYRGKREKLYLSISTPNYEIDSTGYNFEVSATQADYKEVIEYD